MPPVVIPDLPINTRREDILAALRAHQVVVVAGETGSGKTTQLPKMCLELGLAERGRIGCTQPRRVAALSVSRRVAEELGVPWGREVGCKMRFNDDTSRETKIKFMTDGILLAEIQSDPMLRAYSTIIVDEAHERSLNIDFLLGHLQGLVRRRGDLRVVITSATIDTAAFAKAFGGAPVIEVSGRLFPVEIRYAPVGSFARGEEADELPYLEAVLRATEDALIESDDGDVLVFLPTEREIREACDDLSGTLGPGFEVLGLYGRMPAAEQQRVFQPGPRRRVIVATNIAETSITLPRVRYVIDAGLTRMSRYNPRTRTRRLPVEEISQSSARQRAGRAGRVQQGICIRLYDEEDFSKRPPFTQPEIQRANLAEVILRMKAFRLGQIETFPFIDPPSAAAIRAGYTLLHELGALNDTNELTPLGRELARLPVDPTLGRMLLQAREENALPEMLIIAAGLSVPDPRERPEEQKEAAAAAHKAFHDPDSDFLTLLNIWRASPNGDAKASSNALRRFCKTSFMSWSRLREWRDLHRQLAEAMEEEGARARRMTLPAPGEEDYAAVHRSVLAGLLGHIALREERNSYKAGGNKLVTLFPGSNLYERREERRRPTAEAAEKVRQPQWIVAGEIVETSQLFARTAAGINPEWVLDLGAHLCRYSYTEPHWSAKAQRVLATERVLIHGLEIARRQVDFGRVDPEKATELFIRGALVAQEGKVPQRFYEENRMLRERIENALTRVRSRRALDLEESFYRYYAARLSHVSSVHDLNKLVRERIGADPAFLCATEEDLLGEEEASYDRTLFPDQVMLANTALPITYQYAPGEETDGVTVRVPVPLAQGLTTGELQWLVPGLREEYAGVLLRGLPKAVRKRLMPLEPKIQEVAREFQPGRGDFLAKLAEFLSRRYHAPVTAADFPTERLPAHLQPRVEVVDRRNRTVAGGRDLQQVKAEVEKSDLHNDAWAAAMKRWEQGPLTAWPAAELPGTVEVEKIGATPVLAWPGLKAEEGGVFVRLFRKQEEAERASGPALRRLAETVLTKELARTKKDLGVLARQVGSPAPPAGQVQRSLQQLGAKLSAAQPAWITPEVWEAAAYEHTVRELLTLQPALPLTRARFQALVAEAQRSLPGMVWQMGDWTRQLLTLRQQVLAAPRHYATRDEDVRRLLPADFLARTPHRQLPHLHRYLRAVMVRNERAGVSPARDMEKAKQITPFIGAESLLPPEQRENFRWMLEEFRVSTFAQELGTAQPVSATRLRALLGEE